MSNKLESRPVTEFFEGYYLNARFAGECLFRLPTFLRQVNNKESFLDKLEQKKEKITDANYSGMLALSLLTAPTVIGADLVYSTYQAAANSDYTLPILQGLVLGTTNLVSGIYETRRWIKNRKNPSQLEKEISETTPQSV